MTTFKRWWRADRRLEAGAARCLRFALVAILLLIAALLSYFTLLFFAHDGNPAFLKIDSCLDGGGGWNYEQRRCEG